MKELSMEQMEIDHGGSAICFFALPTLVLSYSNATNLAGQIVANVIVKYCWNN